jgi:hypothetical protein
MVDDVTMETNICFLPDPEMPTNLNPFFLARLAGAGIASISEV